MQRGSAYGAAAAEPPDAQVCTSELPYSTVTLGLQCLLAAGVFQEDMKKWPVKIFANVQLHLHTPVPMRATSKQTRWLKKLR